MSNPSALGSITYEAESSWGEDVNTFATLAVPTAEPIDCSGLTHAKIPADYVEQYRTAGHRPHKSVQGGSFKVKLWLPGHGTSTSGSPTVTALETLLNRVFGGTGAFSLATSQTLTGGTATAPSTSGATGVTAGGVVRIGVPGDTDGEGQMFAVSTHAASTLNLLNDLAGAPVNGAVLLPTYMMFTNGSPTSVSVSGTRFRLQTANAQYRCHGCYPMAVEFSGLSAGETPAITITWGVSWWTDSGSDTFPNTVATERVMPSPSASGSLHVNAVGTSTRAVYQARNVTLTCNLGVEPLRSHGGVNQYQDITGAVRTGSESWEFAFTVDAEAAGTTTLADWGRSEVDRFIMLTLNSVAGRAVGFKMPKVCSADIPVQMRDGSVNRYRFSGRCYSSDTLTSEVTRAPVVICFG